MKPDKTAQIAVHFNAPRESFRHRHGFGWYYYDCHGQSHFLSRNYDELQSSIAWVSKKLPGRDK